MRGVHEACRREPAPASARRVAQARRARPPRSAGSPRGRRVRRSVAARSLPRGAGRPQRNPRSPPPTASSPTLEGGTSTAKLSAPSRSGVPVSATSTSSMPRSARISTLKCNEVTPARSRVLAGAAAGAASEAPSASATTTATVPPRIHLARRALATSPLCRVLTIASAPPRASIVARNRDSGKVTAGR